MFNSTFTTFFSEESENITSWSLPDAIIREPQEPEKKMAEKVRGSKEQVYYAHSCSHFNSLFYLTTLTLLLFLLSFSPYFYSLSRFSLSHSFSLFFLLKPRVTHTHTHTHTHILMPLRDYYYCPTTIERRKDLPSIFFNLFPSSYSIFLFIFSFKKLTLFWLLHFALLSHFLPFIL